MDYLLFAQGMMFVLCGVVAWRLHLRSVAKRRNWLGGGLAIGAVERCQREEFDLILLDLPMPVLDGLSAAKQIRASQSPLKKVPRIFAFTANAFVEDRQACLAAGMDGALTKPVTLEQLHGLIVESDALPS
jgi:CheY-like chemotaxis protein